MLQKRRSRKLIDFEVQASLVARLCMHWILFLMATAIAMFLWIQLFESPTDNLNTALNRFTTTFTPLLIVALAILPVFVYDAVKLSNRFTGPVFRLRQTLTSLANGQPAAPLEFRSNDFWQSLATDFNRVVKLDASPATESPTAVSDKT